MSKATFDDKFGAALVSDAPTTPGVYRFMDGAGRVLYVGKAKNLRRRLANYRNATRKRVHRKMRVLVRESATLSYETCESESAALLLESELIRSLGPEYNVDGAFAFLYPSIGVGMSDRTTLLCFTTHPEEFSQLDLKWYGCFRSRPRVKLAFGALLELLGLVAHREKSAKLPSHPRIKGSQLAGFRQVPSELAGTFDAFFRGTDRSMAGSIARLLLSKPRALQNPKEIQTHLTALSHFFEADALRLCEALRVVGSCNPHVSRDQRDALFIRARAHRARTDASPTY